MAAFTTLSSRPLETRDKNFATRDKSLELGEPLLHQYNRGLGLRIGEKGYKYMNVLCELYLSEISLKEVGFPLRSSSLRMISNRIIC